MRRPSWTCPKKEVIEDILKEFSDCSIINEEIDDLADNLKKSYQRQYDHYVDQILDALNDYKDACEKLRDFCNYQEKVIEDQEREIERLSRG